MRTGTSLCTGQHPQDRGQRKVQRQLRLFQQYQLCLSVDAAVVQPGSKTVELNFVIFHFKCQFRIFESITLPDQISDGKLPVQRKCLVNHS